ncbi:hypothetical protein EMCRGX_G012437 [Ephydatia muelleri]
MMSQGGSSNLAQWSIYSGQDSFVNLKICLERYAQQLADIEAAGWRGKKIRFFLCGDYEFLCEIEGRSGASGRHFSKTFNNAIRQPLFLSIPLSQVCPPGLHITMGIFLRLFVLLEEDCHKLDCRAVVLDGVSVISYDNYCAALVTKRELMDEMVSLKDTIQCFEQHVGKLKQRLNVVGEEIDKLEVTLKVDFKKEDGPFVKALDNALASFHVKKQAYYSGTFVGNHVHRALKVNNVAILCNSIKCHNIYDKNIVSDEEIEQLEDSIGAFMAFYRKNFATHSVLPKMHFLEVHVVPYLKQWHMGFGFMGEQGVESIHHYFNDLERTYCGVRDPAQKLQRDKQELSMAEMGLLEVDGRITFSKTVAFDHVAYLLHMHIQTW